MLVDANEWWSLDDDAARTVAASVADGTGSTLVDVRTHTYAGWRGRTAIFDIEGTLFAFVPGGEVNVGYDASRFAATPDQAASFARSAEEFGVPGDIAAFVDAMTSPARTVVVAPLLVAVEATSADGPGPGQRLMTPDEWEYACGAGVPTLFRWGDAYPPGADPTTTDSGPHRQPNAFGLHIGQDPYLDERTADPTVVCGGDGGNAACAGAGEFLSWLPLATAYRDPGYAEWLRDNADAADQVLVRPAIPLG